MTHQFRLFLVAVQFYSRLPITGRLARWMGWENHWLAPATRYFPLVGALVGSLQLLAWWLLTLVFSNAQFADWILAALLLALGIWLTGAFHEDGFADSCDGFGGQQSRERTLDIMRDSRLGTYGTCGLVLLLLLKWLAIAELLAKGQGFGVGVLILAATTSRSAVVVFIASTQYSPQDKSAAPKPLATSLDRATLWIGVIWGALALGYFFIMTFALIPLLASLGVICLALAWWRAKVTQRLGGFTGDTLGATQQIAEVILLFGLGTALT